MVDEQSQKLIVAGFGVILMMLLAVLGLWIQDTRDNLDRIEHLVDEHEESRYLSIMRDRAQRRVLALHRMVMTDDPFERDEQYMTMRELASEFLTARESMLKGIETNINNDSEGHEYAEYQLWEQTKDAVNKGGLVNNQIAALILNKQDEEARNRLIKELPEVLDNVNLTLSSMYDMARNRIDEQLEQAIESRETTYTLITMFGGIVMLFWVYMAWLLKRSTRIEANYHRHSNRVRQLYELSYTPGMSIRGKLVAILQAGCKFLDMELGVVSRMHGDSNAGTMLFSFSNNDRLMVTDGDGFTLNESLPQTVTDGSEIHCFTNLEKGLGSGSLELVRSGIIARLMVNEEDFGYVAFCNSEPRSEGYSTDDQDLVGLITTWISVTLETLLREKDLEEARMRSEAANRTKSGFLANMSHELRTPLNAIIGYSELIEENSAGKLNQDDLEDLHRISASGKHLLSLINDILDISKIEAGKLELDIQDQDIGSLVYDVAALVQPLMDKSGNTFSMDWPERQLVMCYDEVRLKQILLNILGNAAKFCHNGNVSLKVCEDNTLGFPRLVFEVSDTGIGIAPEKISRLFKPFSQVASKVSGEFGGTGLGLAISRRLAIMMEGNIEVSSKPGEGTIFRLWLPIHSKQQMEHGQLMMKAGESSR